MNTRWIGVLTAALFGCGPLLASPGDDFRVKVHNASPIVLVQQVEPVELVFEVNGCDDFAAVVDTGAVGARRQHVIEPKRRDDGLFSAMVPVDFLRSDTRYCLEDAQSARPAGAQLVVTCRLDGRTLASDSFAVTYATAWRATGRTRGPVDAVLSGATPDTFFTIGAGWLDINDSAGLRADTYAAVQPGVVPRLAQSGDAVYLWTGCPIGNCGLVWIIDTPERKVGTMAANLQVFSLDASRAGFSGLTKTLRVPASVVDMAIEPGGDVVLLSTFVDGGVLSRVHGDEVTFTPLPDGETDVTSFAQLGGDRAFLARTGDDHLRLRRSDGSLVKELTFAGTESGSVSALSLAPSGDQWVYMRGGREWWIGGLDRATMQESPAVALGTELRTGARGAVWLDGGVGLWNDDRLEIISRGAPNAAAVVVSPRAGSADVTPRIRGALGMGGAVALVTGAGMQIFDTTGRLLAGADPLAPECAPNVNSMPAAVLDERTAILGGQSVVYRFRTDRTGVTDASNDAGTSH